MCLGGCPDRWKRSEGRHFVVVVAVAVVVVLMVVPSSSVLWQALFGARASAGLLPQELSSTDVAESHCLHVISAGKVLCVCACVCVCVCVCKKV